MRSKHDVKAAQSRFSSRPDETALGDAAAWAGVGDGWQQLHGCFRESGYSLEWHHFTTDDEFDWSPSFRRDSVEICVNLRGHGTVKTSDGQLDLTPLTAGFYLQGEPQLRGARAAREWHEFITFEFSFDFLKRFLCGRNETLHPRLKKLFAGRAFDPEVSEAIRLTGDQRRTAASLRRPPVQPAGRPLWYRAKALEVASALFYPATPAAEGEFFCQRQKRLNHERVQKVVGILREELAQTLSLEEIGRRAGCSHFYLSRIFREETGRPIFQYLRELRLERAAELLREGRLNVTQVAMEVGYSSPSHFSTAFHAMFGCCPGLYPLATASQQRLGGKPRAAKNG